ncbi:MAG TPA: tryptophan synthase subunit alpha [Tepidisphaeraceae bacterium]|nr:tryptophan synthase subunit alpha [Tepidisphaeraceae bacterium]
MTSALVARRSIAETFAALRERGRIGLMPFVAAGFPDLPTTAATMSAIEAAGAHLIEVGTPFSDPIADGPTIQEAFVDALAKKVRVDDVLAMVAERRPRLALPLVSMLSYSIVFRYGLQRYLTNAKQAGFDALILPDLPPPEAQRVCDQVRSAGLDTVLLVAPTTTVARRKEIAKLSSGFIYYLSVSGITGERNALPADLEAGVRQMRELTDRPVCVGFGISQAKHVRQLTGVADGAIVGSAIVKRMRQHQAGGPGAVASAVGAYCRELLTDAP